MINIDFGFTDKIIRISPTIAYIVIIILMYFLIYTIKKFKGNQLSSWIWYVKMHFRQIWFFATFFSVLTYCIFNWSKVIQCEPLTANPFILAFLGVLLVLPYINKFDIFGIKGEMIDMFTVQQSKERLNQIESKQEVQNSNSQDIQESNDERYKLQQQFRELLNKQKNERGL